MCTTIITTHRPATNFRGARIKADAGMGRYIFIDYPHHLSGVNVHFAAAEALCKKFNWTGSLSCGALPKGYAFVFNDHAPFTV